MGLVKRIHHIGLATKSLDCLSKYLINSFFFNCAWIKPNECILRSNDVTFLAKSHPDICSIDSVHDIAIEVSDMDRIITNAWQNNVDIIEAPKLVADDSGSVIIAQIKSCVGNVVHTLIDKKNYPGHFLPGYDVKYLKNDNNQDLIQSFDHITFAVGKNSSNSIIDWYSAIFGMKRMLVNRNDSMEDGFVFHHKNSGMRLKAFEYWKCDEKFIGNDDNSCKFVIAEELNDHAENQIGTFLHDHEGPGIQHIGLSVHDIVATANTCSNNSAKFLKPPNRYYEIISKNPKITELNISMETLEKTGILIDPESEESDISGDSMTQKFLFQIFTQPVFDRNTFFLELIERHGARGFGSGNIKALWDAVDSSLCSTINQQDAG